MEAGGDDLLLRHDVPDAVAGDEEEGGLPMPIGIRAWPARPVASDMERRRETRGHSLAAQCYSKTQCHSPYLTEEVGRPPAREPMSVQHPHQVHGGGRDGGGGDSSSPGGGGGGDCGGRRRRRDQVGQVQGDHNPVLLQGAAAAGRGGADGEAGGPGRGGRHHGRGGGLVLGAQHGAGGVADGRTEEGCCGWRGGGAGWPGQRSVGCAAKAAKVARAERSGSRGTETRSL